MKLTRKQAMDKYCFDCGWDSNDKGTKHQQIESCQDVSCALHEYRPITQKTKDSIKAERIANFTPKELDAYKRKGELFKSRVLTQKQG